MKADRETFIGQLSILGRDALFSIAVSLYDKIEELRLKQLENERISTGDCFPWNEGTKKSWPKRR